MTRTILVTGARGFIGAAVVRRLLATPDVRVVAVARSRTDEAGQNVDWIESPLEDLATSNWRAIQPLPFDAVVHLAAFTPKSGAERDRSSDIIRANILGMQRLLDTMPQPPRRLVFASTLDVYARSAFNGTVTEQSPIGPAGLYGLSKLFGEGLAESYARAAGIEQVTLRIGHIYGPGEERYAKLVPATIRRVLAAQPPRIAGDGGETRDLLYVDDAAEAIVRACLRPVDGTRIINIARGESHSIREVAGTIAALAGYAGSVEQAAAAADSYSTLFDTAVMRRVLGTWPLVPLAEGLRREIAAARVLANRL